MPQETANTLQNSTIVRKEVGAHQRAGSQGKCAAIDSINREKVQHVICSGERLCKQSNGTFAMFDMNVPPNLSAVTQEGVNHSKSNKDVAEDIAR